MSQNFDFIDIHLYRKLKFIGGTFSAVYKVQEKSTRKIYIAKCLTKSEYHTQHQNNSSKAFDVPTEFILLSRLNHPTLLKAFGLSSTDFDDEPLPIIILEYVSNGTLRNISELKQNRKELPKSWNNTKLLISLYGVACGMAYIHSNNVIHCDLKPANVLLDSNYYPKISDVGASQSLDPNETEKVFSKQVGTPLYLSPEIIDSSLYSKKSDVYTFAFIIFEIFGNTYSKKFTKFFRLYSMILKGERPEFTAPTPKCYKDLIARCWAQDKNTRPTFEEIAHMLSTNRDFITELGDVDETEFYNYVDMINGRKPFPDNQIDLQASIDEEIKEEEPLSIQVPPFDLSNYVRQRKIGEGAFGVVYEVKEKKSEELFSAKISKLECYNSLKCQDTVVNFIREVTILYKMNHPSIMRFIGYSPLNFKGSMKPVVVTELIRNGSLGTLIEQERKGLSQGWNDTKKLINLYGIAHGLKYMHSQEILHRDLKPANILVDDYLYPKLCDFGLSKNYVNEDQDCERLQQTQLLGTLTYIAPEIFTHFQYSKASDVYSYSLVIYEILTATLPILGTNEYQIAHNIIKNKYRPPIPPFVPDCYRQLIEDCWQTEPEKRPTFDDIVDRLRHNHDFITENVDEDEYLDYIDFLDQLDKSDVKIYPIIQIEQPSLSHQNIEGNCDLSQYEKGEKLGRDLYWKYYTLTSRQSGQHFIGQISNNLISNMSDDEINEFYEEMTILSKLTHPNLIKIHGYNFNNFKSEAKPLVINEFYKRRTLSQIIEMSRHNLIIENWTDTTKLINLFGIASAMSYLHLNGISFHELNPNSIIVDNNLYPKLTNYGFFMKLQVSNSISQSTFRLHTNPIYQSPEVLRLEPSTPSSEVYSFGMIAYEICVNEKPFSHITRNDQIVKEIVHKGARPIFPKDSLPVCYQELIEHCWKEDPSERPSFHEIVELLKSDRRFITANVNEKEYNNYIQLVNQYTDKCRITEI